MRFHWLSGLGVVAWGMPAAQRKCANIAYRSPDGAAREHAVRQLTDRRVLEWLALRATDPVVRRLACGKVDSLKVLFSCLSRDSDIKVRWQAVDRARSACGDQALAGMVEKRGSAIRDQSLLASLVCETAAIDANAWREMAARGENPLEAMRRTAPELELAAVGWIKDAGMLAYLACHHGSASVREAARARYPADGITVEALCEEVFPYGCPTCQYVSDDPLALRVPGLGRSDFKFARVECPRCHRTFDVSPSEGGSGSDWVQNLSNGPLFWEVRDCPQCQGRRTLYRVEFPRQDQSNCRRCGWGESKQLG